MKAVNNTKLQGNKPHTQGARTGVFLGAVFLSIAMVSCNDKETDEPAGDVTPSLEEARQDTKAAKEDLAKAKEKLETARHTLAKAVQNPDGNSAPTEETTNRETTTANPDKTEAQNNYQEALANFQRIEREWQAQQKKVTEAEAREERLQTQLEQWKARQAAEQAEYDALSRTEKGQLTAAQNIQNRKEIAERLTRTQLTLDETEAFKYKYPDKYMNKISNQEAIFLTTHHCSENRDRIHPTIEKYYQLLPVTCKKYNSWIGTRNGLECICRFTYTLNGQIFYFRKGAGYESSITISLWPEIYERLTSSQ